MIPLSKPRIEDLVAKEIVLTNFKNWTNKGTIWTLNQIEYGFIFRIFEKCVGQIYLEDGDLRYIRGNLFYYPTGIHGVKCHHGGKNPYSFSENPNPLYEEMSAFLDEAVLKRR